MAGRQRFNFWLDEELREGLRAIREREGILESEQVRRAIADWLQKKGAAPPPKKAAPRRAQTRRKA